MEQKASTYHDEEAFPLVTARKFDELCVNDAAVRCYQNAIRDGAIGAVTGLKALVVELARQRDVYQKMATEISWLKPPEPVEVENTLGNELLAFVTHRDREESERRKKRQLMHSISKRVFPDSSGEKYIQVRDKFFRLNLPYSTSGRKALEIEVLEVEACD